MKQITFILFLLLSINFISAQVYLEQVSNTTANLKSVHTTNWGNIAWACGYTGAVVRTSNAGYNWVNVSGNGIPSNINLINIFGIDNSTAITAGYTGTNTYVYRTSNAGANWTTVFSQPNGFINAVWIRDDLKGFMYGDPVGGRWSLWKTTNGGINWDSTGMYLPQNGSEAGWNNSLFVRNLHIWFGTNNTRIYHSSNFGLNWTTQSTASEQNSYCMWFFINGYFDSTSGFAGGTTMLQTSNDGSNWVSMSSSGSGIFGGFTGNPPGVASSNFPIGTFWYVRSDNKIYFSFGANSWQPDYTAPSGSYNCLSLGIHSGLAFAVRNNGGITRVITQWGEVRCISDKIPLGFILYQNYPNPFNPKTTIEFSLLKPGNVKLTVFNVPGKEITTLVNQNMHPGTYAVDFDGGGYSSGVYFYRLETPDFIQTKKMVLTK